MIGLIDDPCLDALSDSRERLDISMMELERLTSEHAGEAVQHRLAVRIT